MSKIRDELDEALAQSAARALGGAARVANLQRLSGGASQESWRFDLEHDAGRETLVLRRSPPGRGPGGFATVDLATEARLIEAAAAAGVPVPRLRWELTDADQLGSGYVMAAVAGETLPGRILRKPEFDAVRDQLAAQCGAILARLHAIPKSRLPQLPVLDAATQLRQLRSLYDGFGEHRPVLEWAFAWLAEHAPASGAVTLVHGDFRNGNLMVHPDDGVRAVLDWELAHLGDPMEDLGWLCVPSWRFGAIGQPVGGFGAQAELFTAYEGVAGAPVDADRVRYWQIFGSLKWGVICLVQAFTHLSGQVRSVELAAIGRRVSEAEIDLLAAVAPRRDLPPPPTAQTVPGPRPGAAELLDAVGEYLREDAAPALAGRRGFHARVAANAAAICAREARLGPPAAAAEHARLRALLGRDGSLDVLNTALCRSIRDGRLATESTDLVDHLWASTIARVAIDQPDYATYRRLFA